MDGFGPLVDGSWLARTVREPDVRVIDFRRQVEGRPARAAYEAGHIPGAVFVDMEGEVTGRRPGAGRHPLPEPAAFQAAMRAAGVNRDSRVVGYDDEGGFPSARLWWMLRYFGHDAVAVLDGGMSAWPGQLSTEPVTPEPGDFVAAPPREEMKVDYEAVRGLVGSALLLDAREPERYRGEVEPLDPVAGHIPGARSAHHRENLRDDLRFKRPEELRRRFEALGVRDASQVISYCGSGVSACNNLLAMELAGLRGARLYPGSWSDWLARPGAEIATGEEG